MAGKRSFVWRDGSGEDTALLRTAMAAADIVLLSSDIETPHQAAAAALVSDDHVACDITGFGKDTNRENRGWSDKLLQAASGMADVTGLPGLAPAISNVPALEFHAGIYAAAAITAAMRARRSLGRGQRIHVSLYECGVNALATYLPLHYGGRTVGRAGNRHPMAAPWNAFKARDGWVMLCSANDEHWQKLCSLMGVPELALEGSLVKLAHRISCADAVDAIVSRWIANETATAAIEQLNGAGIAAGPILEMSAMARDRNVAHRRMMLRLLDPTTGRKITVAGTPLRGSLTPGRRPAMIPAADADRGFVRLLEPRHVSARTDGRTTAAPCTGLRIVEIGQYTTAPLAARQLASLGAEVIKLEPPFGESSRRWPPYQNGIGYFFALSNNGKRSAALNLRDPAERGIFSDLLGTADVLIENLKPGSLARLGFSPARLAEINPRLVYCAISGFGVSSAYPGRPAFDTVIQAMSGLMDLTRVNGVPVKLGVSAADIAGGLMALFAILAFLEHRDRTGKGQAIDLAMQDAALWTTQASWNGSVPDDLEMLACQDGHVAAAAPRGTLDSLATDFSVMPRAKTSDVLRAAGIQAAAVRTVAEVGEDSARLDRGIVAWRTRDGTTWPLLRPPFQLSETPAVVGEPIGPLGELNAGLRSRRAGTSN